MPTYNSAVYDKQRLGSANERIGDGPGPHEVGGDVYMARAEVDRDVIEDDDFNLFILPKNAHLIAIGVAHSSTDTADLTYSIGTAADDDRYIDGEGIDATSNKWFVPRGDYERIGGDGILKMKLEGANPPADFEASVTALYVLGPDTD